MFWRENTSGRAVQSGGWSSQLKAIFLEEAVASFAAQSLIFPILILAFSSINLLSFLANPVLLPWIGSLTQAGSLEYLLSLLEKWWWARVLLSLISQAMEQVLTWFLAAVAWWQRLFFLNSPAGNSGKTIAWFWWLAAGLYFGYTRIKPKEKGHFFHENP
jgi:hypothetical protein